MAYVEVDEPIVLDSTGQDIKDELTAIKSAVQGLGTALGSDKANISGDNIASPATFRQNIGLSVSTTTTGTNGGVLRKYDCVVQLKFDNANVTNRGSIPSDYRPNARILTSCVLKKLSTNKWYQGMISIDTTGGFTIYYMNTDGTITDITTNSDWTISVSVAYIN